MFIARGLPPTLTFVSGRGETATSTTCTACTRDARDAAVLRGGVRHPVSGLRHHAAQPARQRQTVPLGRVVKVDVAPPQWAIDMLMGRVVARVRAEAPSEDEPPVALAGDALERWYGRLIGHRNADGSVARGLCLWDIGCDLEHAGATRRTVRAAVEERDGTLGWDKFNVRNDAEIRYDDIVTNVFTGQTPRVRLKKADAPAPAPTRYGWMTAQEIREVEEEDIAWFATGFVGNGLITLLDGKAKLAGKTTLLLALVHAVLYGEEFLGQPTSYIPVLYLTEQSGPSFRRNLSRAGLLDRPDLHVLMWSRIENPEWPGDRG